MSATNSFETAILDTAFRGNVYTQPAGLYVGLFSTAPTDSTSGTELAGNNYSRQSVTFAAANTGSKSSNANVVFSATGNAWSTAVAMGIFDASTTGNLLVYKALSPTRTLNAGDTLTFESGAITITLD